MNITIKGKIQQSQHLYKPVKMKCIFANYLMNYGFGEAYLEYFESYFFQRKYKYWCIRVSEWFKDDELVIWMWIRLILKNISILDRMWSLWLVYFAHAPTNFILSLGRLTFSVSINAYPDNIYISCCGSRHLFW